jgi:hypothetical protein
LRNSFKESYNSFVIHNPEIPGFHDFTVLNESEQIILVVTSAIKRVSKL